MMHFKDHDDISQPRTHHVMKKPYARSALVEDGQ